MITEIPFNYDDDNSEKIQDLDDVNMTDISKMFKDIAQNNPIKQAKNNLANDELPPMDFYKPKVNVNHDCVNYGLNMYFKKPHAFSDDGE